MAILTEDMKRLVREQGLGFYATVCEDGSPNLSPKGTTRVQDDDHLFFAEIRSPQTVASIRRGSLGEIEDRELRDAPLILASSSAASRGSTRTSGCGRRRNHESLFRER